MVEMRIEKRVVLAPLVLSENKQGNVFRSRKCLKRSGPYFEKNLGKILETCVYCIYQRVS